LKKDFYKILGLDQEASPARIKKAYRKAAKRYHPDVSPKGEDKFKEVQEAYETLSDPQKKVLYDQQFLEKLTSNSQLYSFHEPSGIRPNLFDEIERLFGFDDLFEFFTEPEKRHPNLSVAVEITLTPEEARRGCEIPLKIPFWSNCERCHGKGRIRNLICGLCRGQGGKEIEREIKVSIPAGVRNGMEVRIPLKERELGSTELIATVKVSRY
jgi:molecular chaperone DnaJ